MGWFLLADDPAAAGSQARTAKGVRKPSFFALRARRDVRGRGWTGALFPLP
jgi:hypothetical protein